MIEEQLEFDFMIKGNQNFEGYSTGTSPDFTVLPTGNITFNPPRGGPVDPYKQNQEIILLLQVMYPEIYTKIMDALRAKDVLQNQSTW